MYKHIKELKDSFSTKSIGEIRKIATDGGANYSPEAIWAAEELLLEREPETDTAKMMLHLQRKNESILGEMEMKVGCLYQFLIFQVVITVIGFLLGFVRFALS